MSEYCKTESQERRQQSLEKISSEVTATDARIAAHEDICALRYKGIHDAIQKLDEKLTILQANQMKFLVFVVTVFMAVSAYLYIEVNKRTYDRYTQKDHIQFEQKVQKQLEELRKKK